VTRPDLAAVVFDFDGLILDTEWPIYETARSTFAHFGHRLDVEDWVGIVGLADGDGGWYDQLCARLGVTVARTDYDRVYLGHDRSDRDRLEPLPGVVDLLGAVRAAGLPVGIASSSELEWIERHLNRLSILDRFDAVTGVDHVGGVGKPEPDVYLAACRALGAEPANAVAIEDSGHGVAAAKAAGMACVAVPNRITRHTDLSAADLVVDSLADVTVSDLEATVRDRGPITSSDPTHVLRPHPPP